MRLLRLGGFTTQTDPIGIAGGLNLYGYAGGDPINFSDPFGLDPCDGIVDFENLQDATTDQFEEYWKCINKKWAEQAAEDAEAAVHRAEFYEAAECAATIVSAGGSAASDGLLFLGVGSIVKGVTQAVSAPLWRAPTAWAIVGERAASVSGRRATLVGGGVVVERIGGGEADLGDFTSRFAAVQTPGALRRAGAACSR